MANNVSIVSPLDQYQSLKGAGASVEERPLVAKVTLRGNPNNADFLSKVESVLGVALPVVSSTFVSNDKHTVYWVGPDEWLIFAPLDSEQALIADLRAALDGIHAAVVGVTNYYVTMRISGEKAREVIEKGCHFDMHPRAFQPGRVVGTLFQKATILLAQVDDTTYDISVRWTYAEYMWLYLTGGASEFN